MGTSKARRQRGEEADAAAAAAAVEGHRVRRCHGHVAVCGFRWRGEVVVFVVVLQLVAGCDVG